MLAVFWKRPGIEEFGKTAPPRRWMLRRVMPLLDLSLRSAGVTLAVVFMAVLALRGGWRACAGALAVVGCAAAYLVCAAPAQLCGRSPLALPLALGAIAFPFALWTFARGVLEDQPRVALPAWAALAALLVSGMFGASQYIAPGTALQTIARAATKVLALGFIAAAFWSAWRSWDGDLVEPRRRLRWLLVAYVGAYGLVVLAVEVYLMGQRAAAWLEVLNAALIALTLLASLLYLVGIRPQAMQALFAPAAPARAERPPAADTDGPLLARLQSLMQEEKLYREQDLSVAGLAARLGVPEHVLRRLINERLGARNFAAFVNDFRLREVSQRLADPALERRPVLTLALEAGFGSIGPFNRLFRDRYGVTPTEFRAAAFSGGRG